MTDARLREALEQILAGHHGAPVSIRAAQPIGGGCISDAFRLETSAGPYFLKTNSTPLPRLFESEAEGLRALGSAGALTVPVPIHAAAPGGGMPGFILMTFIESARRAPDFWEAFGRGLARLHRTASAPAFGFPTDNYCGATPQPNPWTARWTKFYREHRLGHQLRLAERNGHGATLAKAGAKLLDRLDDLLDAPAEPPSLLHGDLWSGNFLTDGQGHAALIDPAAYYGHREADLAMTHLFGGFDPAFHRAYEDEWPLADGWRDRLDLYKLYHLLNHANLFGGSYVGSAGTVIRRFVG